MKYPLFLCLMMSTIIIASPAQAQSSSTSPVKENCSNFCIEVNANASSGLRKESNNLSSDLNNPNNMQWQASINIIWRSDSPETTQAEAQRAKQKLEDLKTSMIDLVEAISQNNMARANGLSILLAPKLGYTNPKQLIADIQAKAIPLSQTPQKSTYRYMISHHEMHTA
jgi:hypothetical protein